MKKLAVLLTSLVTLFTLSACSSHSQESQQHKSATPQATHQVKLINQHHHTKLITNKGSITFYKSYRGNSYDNHDKKRFNMVLYSFKATNQSNKPLTAGQIVNNTKLVAMTKVKGHDKELTQPLAYSSAYTSKQFQKQASLNSFEESWFNEPVKPHSTIIVTSLDAFPLVANYHDNEWLQVVKQDDYTKNSVIDKHYNRINLDDIQAKNVSDAVQIIK